MGVEAFMSILKRRQSECVQLSNKMNKRGGRSFSRMVEGKRRSPGGRRILPNINSKEKKLKGLQGIE